MVIEQHIVHPVLAKQDQSHPALLGSVRREVLDR